MKWTGATEGTTTLNEEGRREPELRNGGEMDSLSINTK